MRKFLLFVGMSCIGIGLANAAVRDNSTISRQSNATVAKSQTQSITTRATTTPATRTTTRDTATQTNTRVATARTATNAMTRNARNTVIKPNTTTARAAVNANSLNRNGRTATTTPTQNKSRISRTAARSATDNIGTSKTFGTGYNSCRDAYFTCMDQFCANQNETYRRCVCSSRLTSIQERERALSQTATQLQDFKDLNIEVIPKTAPEVKAMLTATSGETAMTNAKDKSDSAQKLAGISDVLSGTKTKALSTQGTLDIAGDINAIWATTDLASGAQIANLTGEALYNAVHSQCVNLIADQCGGIATLNMVISAYGMYIENDCTTISNALDKKFNAANASIRETESEMHAARLENYNAHNSTSINDCIAQVRSDITAETACGKDYVHCLDVSGKYLNRDTGEPIYTPEFYQLANAISLNGDILNNQSNRLIVAELNRKRSYASRGLETCRDLANEVWDEFMRQAITEIYQGQQERIRQVKTECLDVVNTCYDTQNKTLKDFSNVKEQLLLGSRLELAEEMCEEKLYACANLHGGGDEGLAELISTMSAITDQKIAKQCHATLLDYAKEICAVPSSNSLHTYPYGCRTYVPGKHIYATKNKGICNSILNSSTTQFPGGSVEDTPESGNGYVCPTSKKYIECNEGYYMTQKGSLTPITAAEARVENVCRPCSALGEGYTCPGGTGLPSIQESDVDCGDYPGSLYQKMVRYAMQTCVRPSITTNEVPSTILADVNMVMDSIHVDMAKSLASECQRMGGVWVDLPREDGNATSSNKAPSRGDTDQSTIMDKTTHPMLAKFYAETSANTQWGYCAQSSEDEENATITKSQTGCLASGGVWNPAINSCDCNQGAEWSAAAYRCRGTSPEDGCNASNGTWSSDNTSCTCPTNTSWVASDNICLKTNTN